MKLRLTRSGARRRVGSDLVVKRFLARLAPTDALVAHEAGHLVAPDVMAGTPRRLGELAPAVDRVVLLPEASSSGPSSASRTRSGRRRPGLGVVVGGGGDLQARADRLDPPSTPIGRSVPVGVDEGDYFFRRRSSSAPKKVAAACKMSLERRSSKFSLRSRFSSACSSLVSPGRLPASISARFTQLRSDSSPTPSWRATREITRLVVRVLPSQVQHHAHRPLLQLRRIPLRGGLLLHDSILSSKVWSLQDTQADSDPELSMLSSYELTSLFATLQRFRDELGVSRVGHLEWVFLPMMDFDVRTETLHEVMATDPSFFVEVIGTIVRPTAQDEVEEVPESTHDEVERAHKGFLVLRGWHTVPGRRDDGTIDSDALKKWATEVITLLDSGSRLAFGESHIGEVLAWAPDDTDGGWPCLAVRELLEALQNENVEQGFVTATLNKRGVTSRGLEEGGAQEVGLGVTFQAAADRFRDQWPRAAAILRQLAESYSLDARRAEGTAERFRTGFGL